MSEKERILIISFIMDCLRNIAIVLGFIVLAVAFNKWWIALFSILFWSNTQLEYKTEKESKDE